jgi:kinesin family protein 5
MRAIITAQEAELNRWRKGEDVPVTEQVNKEDRKAIGDNVEQQKAATAPKTAGLTSAEVESFQEERNKLYKQLDERDEEIQNQCAMNEQLQQQIIELEDSLVFTKANAECLEGQVGSISKEHDASKNEMKEVLQALEELAVNYDQKLQEVNQRSKENEGLMDDLGKEQQSRQSAIKELELLQEKMNLMTRKVTEITNTLLGELSEIGDFLGGSVGGMKRPEIENSSQFDEEFTVARLYVSKLKTEVKTMVQMNKQLDKSNNDGQKKIEDFEKDLQSYKLTIAQHEAKMAMLSENIKDVEGKKRVLEEAVDNLNEQLSQQADDEKVKLASLKDKEEKHMKVMSEATAQTQLSYVSPLYPSVRPVSPFRRQLAETIAHSDYPLPLPIPSFCLPHP